MGPLYTLTETCTCATLHDVSATKLLPGSQLLPVLKPKEAAKPVVGEKLSNAHCASAGRREERREETKLVNTKRATAKTGGRTRTREQREGEDKKCCNMHVSRTTPYNNAIRTKKETHSSSASNTRRLRSAGSRSKQV